MEYPAGELNYCHRVIVQVGGAPAIKKHAVATSFPGRKYQGDWPTSGQVGQRAPAWRAPQHFTVPHNRDVDHLRGAVNAHGDHEGDAAVLVQAISQIDDGDLNAHIADGSRSLYT